MQARGGTAVSRLRLVLLGLGVVAFDQLTKAAVVASLRRGESVDVVGDLLRITHLRNSGAAFGTLQGFGGLLALVAVVGVVVFVAILVQRPPLWTGLGVAMIAGGATGNLADRLFRGPVGRGSVVDFVDPRYWFTFNVADSAIVVGAALLLWGAFVAREGMHDDDAARG